jgi:hypothetical protein
MVYGAISDGRAQSVANRVDVVVVILDSLFFFAILARSLRGNSSVGRARPCQGRGREFESRFPLQILKTSFTRGFFLVLGQMAEW